MDGRVSRSANPGMLAALHASTADVEFTAPDGIGAIIASAAGAPEDNIAARSDTGFRVIFSATHGDGDPIAGAFREELERDPRQVVDRLSIDADDDVAGGGCVHAARGQAATMPRSAADTIHLRLSCADRLPFMTILL